MIQTILITALSSQLTYLNPSITPTSTAPQVVFTRVLPEENYVTPVVEKPVVKPKNTELPELQKTIVYNAQLLEPIAGASASPTIIDSSLNAIAPQPKMTPTPQPTAIPAVMTAPPTQAPIAVAPSNTSSSLSDEAITYLGNCEAGMNPTRNSGNGYYGAFQFSYGTWKNLNTGYERADLAPIEVQEVAVKQLLQKSSIYTQFPACARRMHNEGLI